MAYNTRSSSKSKDDKISNGRSSGSSASDVNYLKRSARKTSLRMFSIPSGTWKSERLLKRAILTQSKRRKFERLKQPKLPTPMRRSERIKKHSSLMTEDIAHKCKTDSFRFLEYWVPIQISQVQLEQYCSTLDSNASVLRSSSKNDSVGALRDLLISTGKCCNHPYVVDPFVQTLLTEGHQAAEYLDIGIKASGKLQALDSMLMELKKKGLRVLILFQNRRRAHHIGGSVDTLDFESQEIARKRRKVMNRVVDDLPSNFQGENSSTGNEEGKKAEYEKRRKLCDEQKSLHLLLMPEIAKLCGILLLPDNVKTVVDHFL